MNTITRQWLRDRGACYSDEQIDELVPPAGVTPLQVLDADLPAEDRVWVLVHDDVIGREGVFEFAHWCAERARQYADAARADAARVAAYTARVASNAAYAAARAARAAYYAAYAANAAAYAANAAAAAAADAGLVRAAERQAQLDALRRIVRYS